MFYAAHKKGFSVVEILIGLALFAVIFLFIYETLTLFFANQNRVLASTQALYLAEAGQEYMRYLRDDDWNAFSALPTGTSHYLAISTSTIAVSGTPEVIDGTFNRRFVLWPAYRNNDDDLVASTTPGASPDNESFLVVTVVTWGNGEQVKLESLLGNLQNI